MEAYREYIRNSNQAQNKFINYQGQVAIITKPEVNFIDRNQSIFFYGMSITMGASPSRPGLAYPALVERQRNMKAINLGISGNEWFEKEVLQFAIPAGPAIITLDCTPNSAPDTLLKKLPGSQAPIKTTNDFILEVSEESIVRDYAYFRKDEASKFGALPCIKNHNNALRNVYMDHKDQYKNLYHLLGKNLIGKDNEAAVA